MKKTFTKELEAHMAAGFPMLSIITCEEIRIQMQIQDMCRKSGRKFFVWTCTQGLVEIKKDGSMTSIADTTAPVPVCQFIASDDTNELEKAVFVLCDFNTFLKDIMVNRLLKDSIFRLKNSGQTVIFIGAEFDAPPSIKREISNIDFDLPSVEELTFILKEMAKTNGIKVNGKAEDIAEHAAGLTSTEAENAFAKSLYMTGDFDATIINEVKAQSMKGSVLEYTEPDSNLADVGGMETLKQWLSIRQKAFTKEAKEFGIVPPKGLLTAGIPGCGKSLTAKSIAAEWNLPLLRLDIGKLFGSLVGDSERNARQAIAVAERMAPCVLWIDEIEKGLAGAGGSGNNDSGVTTRVFGTLLTWMQDKTSPVFIVATANNVEGLPPELLRKGRIDEIFFVDVPEENERKDIYTIHINKKKRNPEDFDLDQLSKASKNFTGSEIEESINSAMFTAFSENSKLKTEHIIDAIESTVPLHKTMNVQLDALRKWADGRAVNAGASKKKSKMKTFSRMVNK